MCGPYARDIDEPYMDRAVAAAAAVRGRTSPNPWVGCVVVTAEGREFEGATEPPPGRHAEVVGLDSAQAAGAELAGATVFVTLEPCAHHGRTPPCADALVAAGIGRVVVAISDPDPHVAGRGIEQLRAAGIDVTLGVGAAAVTEQLAPYLHHRRTGRPWVVLKLAASLDGRTAAPDASSRWITGPEARADVHRLRAESDAVLVGAGTVRADNPRLDVRVENDQLPTRQPLRVVLGSAPPDAAVHPCLELEGPLTDVLATLGGKGVVQLLVEGGATVAGEYHRQGLVDQYVVYLAPALFGGDDARPLFTGKGAPTIADVWRGEFTGITPLGPDLRLDVRRTHP
jgi:diaminohydroxyphosphoribosylaminopyrimidine deaminase/5-amino-6-(5-phosphoribosylamino)uracil reductase